ncbi:MAG TPA: trypsin-like peptidase domain-containing protein [Gemmatimonadaceae bacterium]|nr:trypsin-like peptidase domain-containing protein [Gemmatimonadaceae bacterium]
MNARGAYLTMLLATAAGCQGSPQASAAQISDSLRHASTANVSDSRRTAITRAVERVAPSVVTVQTEAVETVRSDPFFDWFMGGGTQSRVVPGLGSGFIVDPGGVIVTNAHVVANARSVSVMMRDGKTYPATTLGTDETNDIAVIRIDAKALPVAPLGNSSAVLIGEWAIAIGNPYGFVLGNPEPTVTTGVISGVGRNLLARGEGSGTYLDMIQTDASINPGNSGGPLVNADGEVIGVNSSIYSPSGGSVGIGFAIPINRVRHVVEDLVAHRAVRRPWVGIRMRYPRTENVREAIASGAVVATVTPGSPAARAGIQPEDVVLQAGPRAVRNPFDWEATLLDLRVGDAVPLRIRRAGRDMQFTVSVADLPEAAAPKVQVLRELELVTLTPAIRAERQIRSRTGALIVSIGQQTAQATGVQTGDVIVQINRSTVATAQDVAKAIDYYSQRGAIRMFVEREGAIYTTDFLIR